MFARRRLDLAARIVGVVFGGYVLISGIVGMRASLRARAAVQHASNGLQGSWLVDGETRDGKAVALDDPARWLKLGFFVYKDAVRADYHQVDGFYDRLFFNKHDAAKKALTLDPEPGDTQATWSYTQHDADHLAIDGVVKGHRHVLALHRDMQKHEWRLLTRGFHWVNESPYNR